MSWRADLQLFTTFHENRVVVVALYTTFVVATQIYRSFFNLVQFSSGSPLWDRWYRVNEKQGTHHESSKVDRLAVSHAPRTWAICSDDTIGG